MTFFATSARLVRRHLNRLRWVSLSLVFGVLVLLPFLHLYQSYEAAHGYDLLSAGEKRIYDSMAWLSAPFVKDPERDLDAIKGTTWTATVFGLKISDPLAVVGQSAAGLRIYWPFVLTALIPFLVSIVLGRVYCGWICPATLVYELNDNLGSWLHRLGFPVARRRLNKNMKYVVLGVGVLLSAVAGTVLFAAVYPPAIIGRELYYAIALGGFGGGAVFFILTLVFDLMVARRGFCRYLCPGGALYSLLGRFRALRIQRDVAQCNDCAKCNVVCQFALDPLHDDFGQECNNCSACVAVCPTDALRFSVRLSDRAFQGPGHLGHEYKRAQSALGAEPVKAHD